MNGGEFQKFSSCCSNLYIGGRIVFAVKKHFADRPRHLDVWLVRQKHPNQYDHTRKLIQRYSASEREKEKKYFT